MGLSKYNVSSGSSGKDNEASAVSHRKGKQVAASANNNSEKCDNVPASDKDKNKVSTKSEGKPVIPDKVNLIRGIGLLEAVGITVGGIIGSGIFISPKGITKQVHSVGASLVIWVVCGFLSTLGAFCYAELGTTFPSAGGMYTYIHEAWGPVLAFLFLWTHNLMFVPIANAVTGLVSAKYIIQPFFDTGCEIPSAAVQLSAAAAICILSFINCCDMKYVNRFINLFMCLKITAVVLIICGGVYGVSAYGTNNFDDIWGDSIITPGSIVYAIFAGGYAFGGWLSMTTMMEELIDPHKNLPRAIMISLSVTTVIYLLANVAYFAVLSPTEMVKSDAVAVTFVEILFGSKLTWIVPIFVSISTFGFLSIHILTNSRNCYTGARNGHFPEVLSLITTSYSSPAPAIMFQCILSLVFLYTADVFALINFSGLLHSVFNALCLTGLMMLRWKRPELVRPFSIPIIIPVIYFILTMGSVIIPIYVNPLDSAISLVLALTGLPVYYLLVEKKQSKVVTRISGCCTIVVQKLLMSVREDSPQEEKL